MALKGNLRDFSTTQLLNLINLARKTGTLTVEASALTEGSQMTEGSHNVKTSHRLAGPERASMSFRDGKLIYAHLGDNNNNLAAVLQEAGILSEEQRQLIQTRASSTGDKQLGHLLIQAGYVTQSDIIQSVRQHILDVVYKLFTWADGLFRFDANEVPQPDQITVPIDLESVIMEGSRRMKEWEQLQTELPDLDIALRFASRPDSRLRNVNLTVEEWRVVSFVSPRNTIRQIAEAVNLSEFQIRRIVYGMLQAGLVETIEPLRVTSAANGRSGQMQPQDQPQEQQPAVKRSVIRRLINRIKSL